MHRFKEILKKFGKVAVWLTAIITILIILFKITTRINPPEVSNTKIENLQVRTMDSNFREMKGNWLQKNNLGLWEMYIKGEAYQRGIINGKLSEDLIYKQEKAFVNQIKEMIPSESYLKFLKSFIAFFNRNIDKHIIEEYQKEIYGISQSASEKFDFIGPNYHRILNYHAAHDIGHALQNMNLVACTAFSGWGSKSADSSLIIGRNFDFYVGDEFAEDKIIMFCEPRKGYPFMIVTWGGMIGATSGMNNQGLTVTLNAAKSDIPFSAATPVSLVAREILQYASTIEQAYEIAKKRKMFVAESIMVGSAKDGKTATIEKSPDHLALYKTEKDYMICSNHFQSVEMQKEEFAHANLYDYATTYRLERVEELLAKNPKLDVNNVAEILRNQKGLNGKNIGMGNEKSVNQLIAHHSIIFKPEELKVWVSSSPFQLGEYACYDLNKVFGKVEHITKPTIIYEEGQSIPADAFLHSKDYKNFIRFKEIRTQIQAAIKSGVKIVEDDYLFNEIIGLNPEFFETYVYIGNYFKHFNKPEKSILAYQKALTKEIPNIYQRENIVEKINQLKK